MIAFGISIYAYLSNKYISSSVQAFRWRRTETESQETSNNPDDKLHDSQIVKNWDNGTEEDNDCQHLKQTANSFVITVL